MNSQMPPPDGLSNAGLSPRERLERIERLLEKIDDKLDGKADATAVHSLELLMQSILQDPAWTGRNGTLQEFDRLKIQVSSLKSRVWAFGIVASTLFAVAGGVAGVIVRMN